MAILGSGKYTCAHAGALVETEQAMHYRSARLVADREVMSYVVPADKYATLQRLNVSAHSPHNISTTANALYNSGLVYLALAGTDKFEARIQGDSFPNNINSGEELTADRQSARFDFGDGFIAPSGAAITVRVVQPAANLGIRWTATLYGVLAGTTEIRTGSVVTNTNTTQNVISYTPGSDFTVQGMTIHAEHFGFLIGSFAVQLNGFPIFESGMLGLGDSQPTFADDNVDALGTFSLPLEGLILREGDRVSVLAAPVAATGGAFSAHLIGDETSVSGGPSATTVAFGWAA